MEVKTEKNTYSRGGKTNIFLKIFNLFSIKDELRLVNNEGTNEEAELLENIKKAKSDWAATNANFEYVSEDDLVDYYTYKMKACQVRYNYLIKKAKEKGINYK